MVSEDANLTVSLMEKDYVQWKNGRLLAEHATYGETYDERSAQPISQIRKDTSLMHGRTAQVFVVVIKIVGTSGIFDMNGNLEEWVLDNWRGLEGNLAGGAWYTHWKYADCSVRYSREPDYRLDGERPIDSAGVRCCWSDWELTDDDISSDAQKHNRSNQASLPVYDSQNEIEVTEGLWMDRYEYPNVKDATRIGVDWFEQISYVKKMEKHFAQCSNGNWRTQMVLNVDTLAWATRKDDAMIKERKSLERER